MFGVCIRLWQVGQEEEECDEGEDLSILLPENEKDNVLMYITYNPLPNVTTWGECHHMSETKPE